ncbi:MAG: sigma-70 family RNA polymerase sigma factor [Lachnospiraceae bacterium]|nr:sigma-70 family RNA polymerase sigma factor [Lachnospiraceae bacterium]
MEELYEQNAKIVFHFLCSICHDENLAEELTQETFLQAFQSLERYDGSCKISTWLCQIAKHLYYQYLRKHNREFPIEIEEQMQAKVDTERQVLSKLELMDVLKEMQKLPDKMREVMYLRISGDLSFKEIGEIMGKSENWARVNFYRGKEKLLERKGKNG